LKIALPMMVPTPPSFTMRNVATSDVKSSGAEDPAAMNVGRILRI
jgi:hypothetical protein